MVTGRKALGRIDDAVKSAKNSVQEAQSVSDSVTNDMLSNTRKIAAKLTEIASIRLDFLVDEKTQESMSRAEQKASQIHQAHRDLVSKLRDSNTEIESEIERLSSLQSQVADAADKVALSYDEKVEATLRAIRQNVDYMKALAIAQETEAIAARAEEKVAVAEQDAREKGAPYLEDPFFSYLWHRQYGTDKAKGWGLTILLDAWIARLCHYQENALNYKRLTDLPKLLQQHADECVEKAELADMAVAALEEKALSEAGVPALQSEMAKHNAEQARVDADLEALQEKSRATLQQISDAVAGETEPYQRAVGILSKALGQKSMPDLRRLAAQTTSPDDDYLVREIRALQDENDNLERSARDAEKILRQLNDKLDELQKIRRKFRKAKYDHPSSQFEPENLIALLIGQLVSGALNGDSFWQQLARAHRYMNKHGDHGSGHDWLDDFSSVGLPGPSRRSRRTRQRPRPRPSSRRRSPRISVPRRSRPGGFKTGGGF